MQRDILIRIIETSREKGSLGSVIKKAAAKPPKVRKVKSKEEEDSWMLDGLNWIEDRCKNGINLVNVTSSNWYFSIGSFHKEIAKRFPLETKSIGGLVWAERLKLDKWLSDIREVGKKVSIMSVSRGTTMDYYPLLIHSYILVSDDDLM